MRVSNSNNVVDRKAELLRLLEKAEPNKIDEMLAIAHGELIRESVAIRGYSASVPKHVNATLVAIHKLMNAQESGETVAPETWVMIENELNRLSLKDYKINALKTEITPRGRAIAVETVETVPTEEGAPAPRRRGRPVGSKNKPKIEVTMQPTETEQTEEISAPAPRRRGRPVGSKNKPKVEATQVEQTEQTAQTEQTVAPTPEPKRRGRPVGSKNKPKENDGQTSVSEQITPNTAMTPLEAWRAKQAAKNTTLGTSASA